MSSAGSPPPGASCCSRLHVWSGPAAASKESAPAAAPSDAKSDAKVEAAATEAKGEAGEDDLGPELMAQGFLAAGNPDPLKVLEGMLLELQNSQKQFVEVSPSRWCLVVLTSGLVDHCARAQAVHIRARGRCRAAGGHGVFVVVSRTALLIHPSVVQFEKIPNYQRKVKAMAKQMVAISKRVQKLKARAQGLQQQAQAETLKEVVKAGGRLPATHTAAAKASSSAKGSGKAER